MPDYLAEFNETSPPVEHFRLQIVVCSVPVLDASDTLGEELVTSLVCSFSDILYLEVREALICHQLA